MRWPPAARSIGDLIAPLLRIPQDEGTIPCRLAMDHGTHVAGILAGDWSARTDGRRWRRTSSASAPDLRLYDLRVLNEKGSGDEFAVMAALQFVRYLNSTNDYMVVHGVNLSLSIPHDVPNYACGRTPVCEECERVVSTGVVVVAAAGNQGYRKYTDGRGRHHEAYNSISITDPGQRGAGDHRGRDPPLPAAHLRRQLLLQPRPDGRRPRKPDLVAPGEKITAPLPDGESASRTARAWPRRT